MAKGSGIHLNPKNKGKFTRYAQSQGEGVQDAASDVLANPDAPGSLKREANFAKNAPKFKHPKGKAPKSLRHSYHGSFKD